MALMKCAIEIVFQSTLIRYKSKLVSLDDGEDFFALQVFYLCLAMKQTRKEKK
jgi:hypothetical protein